LFLERPEGVPLPVLRVLDPDQPQLHGYTSSGRRASTGFCTFLVGGYVAPMPVVIRSLHLPQKSGEGRSGGLQQRTWWACKYCPREGQGHGSLFMYDISSAVNHE